MIEVFIILAAVFWFIIWLIIKASKAKIPQTDSEKDKYYLEQMNEIKLHAQEKLHEQELEHRDSIKEIRKDSVTRSRSSLTGKIWEQVVSLIPGFKHNPADMRFIGSPVDYIVFKGMSKKDIEKIIFLEIKTGDSKLTEQQEKIKRAVKAGRVSWQEYRI